MATLAALASLRPASTGENPRLAEPLSGEMVGWSFLLIQLPYWAGFFPNPGGGPGHIHEDRPEPCSTRSALGRHQKSASAPWHRASKLANLQPRLYAEHDKSHILAADRFRNPAGVSVSAGRALRRGIVMRQPRGNRGPLACRIIDSNIRSIARRVRIWQFRHRGRCDCFQVVVNYGQEQAVFIAKGTI
jgi:hypothetical protein